MGVAEAMLLFLKNWGLDLWCFLWPEASCCGGKAFHCEAADPPGGRQALMASGQGPVAVKRLRISGGLMNIVMTLDMQLEEKENSILQKKVQE